MKKIIATGNAPAAIGPYSQAIDCGSFLVTSGQVPFDPATGEFVPGGITEQTRQVLTNIKAILEAAGLTMDNVVKTTVFLQNMGDFAATVRPAVCVTVNTGDKQIKPVCIFIC